MNTMRRCIIVLVWLVLVYVVFSIAERVLLSCASARVY